MTARGASLGGEDDREGEGDGDGPGGTGTFRVVIEGQAYCVPRLCPHRGGRLAHGELHARRRAITCPLHRSRFDLETGAQLAGPACGPLAVEKVSP